MNNDNNRFKPEEFAEIVKGIDLLAKHNLLPHEVVGLYENRTIHPDKLQRRLALPNRFGAVSIDGFEEGTYEEKETISDALEDLKKMDLSPAFILTMYHVAQQGYEIKEL